MVIKSTDTEGRVATVQVWVTRDPELAEAAAPGDAPAGERKYVEGPERWHRNFLSLLDSVRKHAEAAFKDWTDEGVRTLTMEVEQRYVTSEELTDHEAMTSGLPLRQEERVAREREQKSRWRGGEVPGLDSQGNLVRLPRREGETDEEYLLRVGGPRERDLRLGRSPSAPYVGAVADGGSPAPGAPKRDGETDTEYDERMQRDVQSKPMTTGSFGSQSASEK